MFALRSTTERCTPRCSFCVVNSANQRSYCLSHDAEVGVRWTRQCLRRACQFLTLSVLCVAWLSISGRTSRGRPALLFRPPSEGSGTPRRDGPDPLADHRTGCDVECDERRGIALADMVMIFPLATPGEIGRTGGDLY